LLTGGVQSEYLSRWLGGPTFLHALNADHTRTRVPAKAPASAAWIGVEALVRLLSNPGI